MRRYAITPIIGDGNNPNVVDPWRSSVDGKVDGGVVMNVVALIPPNQTGEPLYDFTFIQVGCRTEDGPSNASPNVYVFPDVPADVLLSTMEPSALNAVKQSVEAYNWDGDGYQVDASYQAGWTWRQYITHIAQQVDPSFSFSSFNVQEP